MNIKSAKNKRNLMVKFIIFCMLSLLGLLCIFLSYFIYAYYHTNLNIELLKEISTPALVYGINNNLIEDNVQGMPYIKIEDINDYTIDAFISIEDKEFYNHSGYNLKRIVSATIKNILSGQIKEGASTITQQLIKNTHLTNDKTINRKIKEIILASKIEKIYSKKQIMEMYLNAIYFGNGCYGIESASQFYFSKSAKDLTLNESAILAGLIKSPANYSPISNTKNIEERKNLVLKQMYGDNAITLSEYTTNLSKSLELDVSKLDFEKQSAYINSSVLEASEILGITPNQIISGNYKIYTYFDDNISASLQESIKHDSNAMHNAIVVDNTTYGITAFNSSYSYGGTKLQRSPASTIKPILVYGAGIEYGKIYPCSILDDNPIVYEDGYSPKNISNKYFGKISAKDALAKSLNIPAINLFKEIGIEKCKSFAKKCGITFDESDNGLSLALGAMKYGITIEELINAYLCFIDGRYSKCTFIRKIENSKGEIIYSHNVLKKKVMAEETAYLVGKMLENTTISGTCKILHTLPFETRAKTGTNGTEDENKNTDMICVTQNTKHTSCIWYFSKDNKENNLLDNPSTSQLSPTIKMKTLLEKLYKDSTPSNFVKPAGIVTLKLDAISYENGKIELASVQTPERYIIEQEFSSKNVPKNVSSNFKNILNTNLVLTKKDNSVELSFNTLKHQKYELYKTYIDNNNEISEKLLVVNNKTDNIKFIDDNLNENIVYKYYVKTINIVSEKYELSNILAVKLENTLTNNDNGIFYYFH